MNKTMSNVSRQAVYVVNIQLPELDIQPADFSGESRLFQISRIRIDAYDPCGAAAFHFNGVETSVAADIQNCLPGKVGWNTCLENTPFAGRVVTQEVIRRRLYSAEIDVMKPFAEFRCPLCRYVTRPLPPERSLLNLHFN